MFSGCRKAFEIQENSARISYTIENNKFDEDNDDGGKHT